jgi:hypothetical protein
MKERASYVQTLVPFAVSAPQIPLACSVALATLEPHAMPASLVSTTTATPALPAPE